MKRNTTLLAAISTVLVLSSVGFTQSAHCAYTFTWPKQSFKFCVSQYGTLGLLQAPIGVDHLDPINPIEGTVWGYYPFGIDTFYHHCQITGVGCPLLSGGTFTEPNGPGTLPLIFSDDFETMTFTATPAAKLVSIKTVIGVNLAESGAYLERDAVFEPGGNPIATFSTTGLGAYALGSYGDRITTTAINGCFGVSPAMPGDNGSAPSCSASTFTGTGRVFAVRNFAAEKGNIGLLVTYWVF